MWQNFPLLYALVNVLFWYFLHIRALTVYVLFLLVFLHINRAKTPEAWKKKKSRFPLGHAIHATEKKGEANFTKILPKLYRNLLRDSQNWKFISFSSSHNLVYMIRRDKYNKRILTFDLPVLYPPNEPVHFFMLFCLLDPDPWGLF